MIENLPDSDLLKLLKRNDQAAFVCIYKRYWSELYRCAFTIFPDTEICEDLIHDLFFSLWEKRETVEIKSLKDYLYISIKNRSLNKLRSEKRYLKAIQSQYNLNTSETPVEENHNFNEINRIFDLALSKLPERCQKIMVLSRKQHLSNKEIASQLNISPKTVENQITIGLRQIRIKLKDFLLLTMALFAHLYS